MEPEFQDKIDDYVMGKLSKEEQRHFNVEILTDEYLIEQLEFTRKMLKAVINRYQKIAAMKVWEHRLTQDDDQNNVLR